MNFPSICLIACFLAPAVSQAAVTALYQFNESSGNAAADGIRGAGGTGALSNFGGTQWVAGKIGNAVEFDGLDDFILAPNAVPTGTTAFSVSAWIWADSAPVWGSIVKNWGAASAGAFHFGFDAASGRISNYVSPPTVGPVSDPSVLSLNTWHHVAVTYDGGAGTQTLYIDGVSVGSASASPSLVALGPNMGIGVKTGDTTLAPDGTCCPGRWDGKIDDLAFFNTALTGAEVAAIKANGDLGIGVVPEPASTALFALSLFGLVRRRR